MICDLHKLALHDKLWIGNVSVPISREQLYPRFPYSR